MDTTVSLQRFYRVQIDIPPPKTSKKASGKRDTHATAWIHFLSDAHDCKWLVMRECDTKLISPFIQRPSRLLLKSGQWRAELRTMAQDLGAQPAALSSSYYPNFFAAVRSAGVVHKRSPRISINRVEDVHKLLLHMRLKRQAEWLTSALARQPELLERLPPLNPAAASIRRSVKGSRGAPRRSPAGATLVQSKPSRSNTAPRVRTKQTGTVGSAEVKKAPVHVQDDDSGLARSNRGMRTSSVQNAAFVGVVSTDEILRSDSSMEVVANESHRGKRKRRSFVDFDMVRDAMSLFTFAYIGACVRHSSSKDWNDDADEPLPRSLRKRVERAHSPLPPELERSQYIAKAMDKQRYRDIRESGQLPPWWN
jgi:hypothetical protein